MNIQDQFKGVIGPEATQYIFDRLTAVVGDFLEADKAIDVAYANRADLAAEKVKLETEIKLDESEALMQIQGSGKDIYVMIGDTKQYLPNEQVRDAYRRNVTKDKRSRLAQMESQIAKIDVEIARAKDRYKTSADAADVLKATAAVQASLLNLISKVDNGPMLSPRP